MRTEYERTFLFKRKTKFAKKGENMMQLELVCKGSITLDFEKRFSGDNEESIMRDVTKVLNPYIMKVKELVFEDQYGQLHRLDVREDAIDLEIDRVEEIVGDTPRKDKNYQIGSLVVNGKTM